MTFELTTGVGSDWPDGGTATNELRGDDAVDGPERSDTRYGDMEIDTWVDAFAAGSREAVTGIP